MEREQQQRVVPVRINPTIKCHNCGNDNLIHGLTLAKASSIMMGSSPGQLPRLINDKWAVYMCISCDSFFPYPKIYSASVNLQAMYKQILTWCETQADARKQRNEHLEKLVSIIESNQDLLGLPGKNENQLEETLAPIMDRVQKLENEFKAKKGGRPKHCLTPGCKTKGELNGYCKVHAMEKNNG